MDLQKENQVKELKELIKGLGANKTENAIVNVCSAAPVINDVVANLDYQLNYKNIQTSHKKRSDEEDLKVLLQELQHIKPRRYTPGRKLERYSNIKANVYSHLEPMRQIFTIAVNDTIQRLQRNLHADEDQEGQKSDDETEM
ncbi:hypothetical protein KP79_PYT00396 [Mizuhopecten yessoensis]|uniref:Uncharacterized protein n=1 Tax=Mizuhopecten yessoensis TaxID=6573 RepID=A0A210QYR6_MIZYE|nr:hypothetical protein KP79_PYT00396 [Mizuhopecten yessoensis]